MDLSMNEILVLAKNRPGQHPDRAQAVKLLREALSLFRSTTEAVMLGVEKGNGNKAALRRLIGYVKDSATMLADFATAVRHMDESGGWAAPRHAARSRYGEAPSGSSQIQGRRNKRA